MTPAERARASRKARENQLFGGFPHRQISVMLGPNANKALSMLCYGTDKTQTEVIESLLIAAYRAKREADYAESEAEFLKANPGYVAAIKGSSANEKEQKNAGQL